MTPHLYDVLIVGAGPVGLATAIALYKRGIKNILVIDRTSDFRRVGQVIDLLPNGLKSLNYIDELTYLNVKEAGFEFRRIPSSNDENKQFQKRSWNYKNLEGKMIRSIPLDFKTWFDRYGEGRVSLPWFDLQTTLRNLLPSEIVRVNYRCVNVQQYDNLVQIFYDRDRAPISNPFAHWENRQSNSSEIESTDKVNSDSTQNYFRAKLVVAADGINSTIRQVMYNNLDLSQWAKPQYSGFSAVGCLRIENVPNDLVRKLESKYFQGDSIITLCSDSVESDSQSSEKPRIILIHQQENTVGYLLHAPLSLGLIQNKSAEDAIALAIDTLETSNFPSSITRLIALSSPENVFYRPYYIHPADIPIDSKSIWSSGRIVLVGDAAHGMPPFAAQGVNQGFEDAALIATLIAKIINDNDLDNENAIANAFSKYEQIRRPFMVKIQEATMRNHIWSQQQWEAYSEMVYRRELQKLIDNAIG